jgi:DNA-binding NtrC family response regulator
MTEGTKSGPRTSVLVVDDEPIVLQSLAAWLRQEGHQVAFVDIKMPDIDGLELQSRLAAADPELTIIIMTAYASVESAVKALKAGAYDYIPKPFNPEELSHLVRRAIEHRSLRFASPALPPLSAPRLPCRRCSTSLPRSPKRIQQFS